MRLTLGQLVVVLVIGPPERVLLGSSLVVVLLEPLHGDRGIVVRVLPLPLIEGEGLGLTESLARVLGLGCGRSLLLVSGSGGCGGSLGCRSGSGGLGLLLGGSVGDGLVGESGCRRDGLVCLLVDDRVQVTEHVNVGLADLGIENGLDGSSKNGGHKEIGEGDAVADKESLGLEGVVKVLELVVDLGLGSFYRRLVVRETRVAALEGQCPLGVLRENVLVGPGRPLEDESSLLLRVAEETSLVLAGEVLSFGTEG